MNRPVSPARCLRLLHFPSVFLLSASLTCGAAMAAAEPGFTLESPDGRIAVSIQLPGTEAGSTAQWSFRFRGKPLLNGCGLGLSTADGGDRLAGARVVREERRLVDERIPVPFGRSNHAHDRFREVRFTLETPGLRRTAIVFRCYDDGVALRYELPGNAPGAEVIITDELTSFACVGDPVVWVQYLENFKTSHEHNVVWTNYQGIAAGRLLDLPLTVSWADGSCVAITEASLRQYAGMSLMRPTDKGTALIAQLTPRPDGTKVVRALPMRTPWRVVLVGDRPGALLESGTIHCLNDPPEIEDISWIRPGKITWPWWNGDVYDGQPGPPILSFEMARKYIDFCARHGIPFHAMTSTETTVTPWYQQSKPGVEPGPDTDVTRPRAGFELAAIRQYAESRGVRLWTWVHQGALRGRVEEAFAAFANLGWSGMMVDFFDHDDQETVEFAEAILAAAARHRIMIHFHGIWKPTGLERTFPNLMNHEGALNLEYLKWSDLCTPEHNLRMAFTRLIAGPIDYHLGGFRAVPLSAFTPRNVAPQVLGSRAHMLAMYVCFDNPVPMVADYPTAYENQPGFDFVKLVPTWWDETRVLAGEIGELLVTARRRGRTWYVGGMTANQPRDLSLSLAFLGPGRYDARLWKDGSNAEANPNDLSVAAMTVTSLDSLRVRLATEGGFVAELTPAAE
jgi:alpha-glucosidase